MNLLKELVPYIHNQEIALYKTNEDISNISWYFDEEHLAFLESGKLQIIELDARSNRNIFHLVPEADNKIIDYSFSSNGKVLYFLKSNDKISEFSSTDIF